MLSYQREAEGQSLDEAMPLLLQHWREVEHYADIPPDPNVEMLRAAAAHGIIRIYSARDDGKIVGYASFVISMHPFYKTRKDANQSALFVLPEYRAIAASGLLRFADEQLAGEGVQVVIHNEKVAHRFSELLLKRGYVHQENVWMKRLDVPTARSNVAPLPRLKPAASASALRQVPQSLTDFAAWYFDGGIKLKPPADGILIHRDAPGECKVGGNYIVASIVLYRDAPFQVELIVLGPGTRVPAHSHEHVDSIEVMVSGALALMVDGLTANIERPARSNGMARDVLRAVPICSDASHEGAAGELGGCFISVQQWKGIAPSHVGVEWQDSPKLKTMNRGDYGRSRSVHHADAGGVIRWLAVLLDDLRRRRTGSDGDGDAARLGDAAEHGARGGKRCGTGEETRGWRERSQRHDQDWRRSR